MCGRTGTRVHSYVLMSNHYHLLLETPEANLVAGMKWLQGTYTQRFNARHRQCGHLFQGRYKAIPVEAESADYFTAVSDYIHLNPARAGLLADEPLRLESYPWSSYPGFVQKAELPEWLTRGMVFGALDLPDERSRARKRYAGWMEARVREALEREPTGKEQEVWRQLRRGWYVGGDDFRTRLMEWAKRVVTGKKRESYTSASLHRHDEAAAERWLAEGLVRLELTASDLAKLRQNDAGKQGLAWLLRSRTVVSDAWIVERLHMGHRSNVGRAITAFRENQSRVREIKELLHVYTD